MKASKKRYATLLVGGFCVLIGLTISVDYLLKRERAKAAQHWPSVKGVLLEAKIEFGTGTRSKESKVFLRVEYTYQVDSVTYKNGRWSVYGKFPKATYDIDSVRELRLNLLPIKGPINVYYNPKDPSFSVLELDPGVYWYSFLTGFFLILIGVFLFFKGLRQS